MPAISSDSARSPSPAGAQLRLLLRLEAARRADAVRRPRAGAWAAALLPAVLVFGALWTGGPSTRPDLADGAGRILLGVLAASVPAFQAYPILFRSPDDAFLRRLGMDPRAAFGLRALRLALLAAIAAAALVVPYAATGEDLAVPARIVAGGALAGWGVGLLWTAGAALRLAAPKPRPYLLAGTLGPDPELAAAGPLVFAPIFPTVVGAVAGPWAGAGGVLPLLAVLAVALAAAALGGRRFARALPRFAPRAGEMAFDPPPPAGAGEMVVGRGLARVLPRRADAARARDAVAVRRRHRWAGRAALPVAIVGVVALLRAGDEPAVRAWVGASCAAVLAVQGVAVVSLGRAERGGPRWLDRALGLGWGDRLVGRWAAGFGLGLGLTVPVALAWAVNASGGWVWPAAAAGTAALAAAASLAAAGR